MIRQIELADNSESVAVFYKYLPETAENPPSQLSDVPLNILLPAFMISELKVAFLLGFQVYLPFLVLDLVVSSVTVSMGMLMLPPNMVSFPLKLILFVMVDGWNLVVGMLLQSFAFT
jgi:flagellar biosynthetic protein FliP